MKNKFSNPYIFSNLWCKTLICQTWTIWYNIIHSLKYQRFTNSAKFISVKIKIKFTWYLFYLRLHWRDHLIEELKAERDCMCNFKWLFSLRFLHRYNRMSDSQRQPLILCLIWTRHPCFRFWKLFFLNVWFMNNEEIIRISSHKNNVSTSIILLSIFIIKQDIHKYVPSNRPNS